MKKLFGLSLIALSLALLVGCGSSGGSATTTTTTLPGISGTVSWSWAMPGSMENFGRFTLAVCASSDFVLEPVTVEVFELTTGEMQFSYNYLPTIEGTYYLLGILTSNNPADPTIRVGEYADGLGWGGPTFPNGTAEGVVYDGTTGRSGINFSLLASAELR